MTTPQDTDQRAQTTRPERVANALGLGFITVAVVIYAWRNLGNRYFWSDEASSLYTSLGWPEIGERSRGIAEAWTASQTHIEPGLFNMLEYLWAVGIGTQIEVLRTLPFLFFVIYILAILILSRFVNAPWYLGSAIVGLMFLENITPYYGVELRPHIAGLSAAVVLPLLAIWLTFRPTGPRFIAFLAGFIFFGSFQYTSYPIQVAIAGVLALSALMAKEAVERSLLWAAAAFATLWLPVTFILIRGNPFGLAGGDAIHAIPEAFFPNLSFGEILSIVSTNMLSPTGLPRTVFIVLIPVLLFLGRFPRRLQGSDQSTWTVMALWLTVTAATVMSFALAMLGFMPWILGTRWSIADVGLIALSLVGLAGILVTSRFWTRQNLQALVAVAAIIVTLVGSIRLVAFERPEGSDWGVLFEQVADSSAGRIDVDLWLYPELRYWVELSGDYNQYQKTWSQLDIQVVGSPDKADTEDVLRFTQSTEPLLIVRSGDLIPDVPLPEDVSVVTIPRRGKESRLTDPSEAPILLIRAQVP